VSFRAFWASKVTLTSLYFNKKIFFARPLGGPGPPCLCQCLKQYLSMADSAFNHIAVFLTTQRSSAFNCICIVLLTWQSTAAITHADQDDCHNQTGKYISLHYVHLKNLFHWCIGHTKYLLKEAERRRRRKYICQRGWLPERASAHRRWLPYTG